MKKRLGEFGLLDGVFNASEKELVQNFLSHLSRVYQFDLSDQDFRFQSVGIGLSKTVKLVAKSDEIYPYFIKIADQKFINKEVSNFNRASGRIPPLHLPPIERVVNSDTKGVSQKVVRDGSLLAFRYIAGSRKGEPPASLFSEFGRLKTYELLSIIDELFQVVLHDLHSFEKSELVPFEHFVHDIDIFSEQKNRNLSAMVARYNDFAESAKQFDMPHGMVHGDLHCENIILNAKHTPVLIDFEMMRLRGCLLNDFAELEVALLVAALDDDVDRYADSVRHCYSRGKFFQFVGIDKLARGIRAIRTNLAYSIFSLAQIEINEAEIEALEYVYNALLMRYICSYSWVSFVSMTERRSIVVRNVLEDIFDSLEDRLEAR